MVTAKLFSVLRERIKEGTDEMKVSIIIPVHNSEKYLKECITSALSQTFGDLEILCIDGGSTDSSRRIIDELRKEDDRILYVQDPNTSYGHKINLGIQMARGTYVAILESDDKMCLEMIEKTYNIAKTHNADVVDVDFYELFCHKGKEFRRAIRKYDLSSYGHLVRQFEPAIMNQNQHSLNQGTCFYKNKDSIIKGIWTALYRKDFILENKIQLNESKGASYQDFSFLFLVSLLSKAVYHLMVPLYMYRKDNVRSSVKDNNKIFEIVEECRFLKNNLIKRNIEDKPIWNLYYLKKYEAFYWNYYRLSSQGRILFLDEYLKEMKLDIERGYLKRELTDPEQYFYTFQILDNKKEFIDTVIEKERQTLSLVKICNILDEVENQDIVVFGAGRWGRRILTVLLQNESRIKGICDNSKELQKSKINKYEIISVEKAVNIFPDALFLIANQRNIEDMKMQLLKMGIKEKNILTFL